MDNDSLKDLKFVIKKPEECKTTEIDDFYEFTIKIGQNLEGELKDKILNSFLLGFCYYKSDLLGIAAIKKPSNGWIKYLFGNAWSLKHIDKFKFEFGFAYTKGEWRENEICTKLIQQLLSRIKSEYIFAVCKVDNDDMIKTLEKNKFCKIGKPIMGTRCNCNGYLINLFIKDLSLIKSRLKK